MNTTTVEGRDLILTRLIKAPREQVFKAWTDPALLKQWFTPRPWTTPIVETDVRVGGSSFIVMRGAGRDAIAHNPAYFWRHCAHSQ